MSEAIHFVSHGKHDPHRAHNRIRDFYDWAQVAQRTEVVYQNVMSTEPRDFWTRVDR